MALTVNSYFTLADRSGDLADIYKKSGGGAIFIVPAGLDRDALLELICGGAPSFGARPAVWTAGDLLSELQRADGSAARVIDPPDHKLILRWLLSGFLSEAAEKGTELAPGFYHDGFVSVLGENIKDLLAEEVSAEALRSALGEDARGGAPGGVLAELYERYTDYLAEYGLADAAQIFTLARGLLLTEAGRTLVAGRPVVFAGFLSFASSQLKLVKTLGELTDVTMFQPETGLDRFHDGIKQLGVEYSNRPAWNVPVVKLEAGSPQLELEAVARELALWACGEGGLTPLGEFRGYGDIGLTVGPERLHVMEYALSRYGIPYNVQAGGTAGDTLLGGLPSLIWRASRSGWNNYETSALLANPLLFGEGGRLLEYDGSALPDGMDAWLGVLPREAGEVIRRAEEMCAEFEKGVSPERSLSLWYDFLRSERAAERAAASAASISALDDGVKAVASAIDELDKKIKKLSDDSKNIGPASSVTLYGAEAAAFINDWSLTATLPVQLPQSRSLTVYAGPPPTLASHGCWIMTGVDSSRWPGVIRESMLLRNDEKARFNAVSAGGEEPSHLPELHEEREQKEAVFRRILATGRRAAVITRAVFNENGEECGESRFVTRALDDGPRSWKPAGVITYDAERALPDGGGPWFPQAEVLCTPVSRGRMEEPPGWRAPLSDEPPKIRVSDIDRWNVCPYMYWCERVLGLESVRPGLYDNRKAGNLTHKVWEHVFRAKNENPKLSIHRCVMDNWGAFKAAEYPELDGDPRLARYEKRLRSQMFGMAAAQDDIERRLAAVPKIRTDTESKLEGAEFGGVLFAGQADRIDRFDGGIVVLDYKLGAAGSHARELQVAAYCAILGAASKEKILGFGWFGHAGPSFCGYFNDDRYFDLYALDGTTKKKASAGTKIEEAAALMGEMAESVKNGEYPPGYKVKERLCKNCAYFTLCRKREKRVYIESLTEEGGSDDGEE